MTPPDSGERQVKPFGACGAPVCRNLVEKGFYCWHHSQAVTIPLSLAQRILAALEAAYGFVPMAGKELQALAAELRAVMPKGTR